MGVLKYRLFIILKILRVHLLFMVSLCKQFDAPIETGTVLANTLEK